MVQFISASTLDTLLQHASVSVIDVRDTDYFVGYIPGSRHIPSVTFDERVNDLAEEFSSATTTLVFLCFGISDKRASTCAEMMRRRLDETHNQCQCLIRVLKGGFSQWLEEFSKEENETTHISRAFDTARTIDTILKSDKRSDSSSIKSGNSPKAWSKLDDEMSQWSCTTRVIDMSQESDTISVASSKGSMSDSGSKWSGHTQVRSEMSSDFSCRTQVQFGIGRTAISPNTPNPFEWGLNSMNSMASATDSEQGDNHASSSAIGLPDFAEGDTVSVHSAHHGWADAIVTRIDGSHAKVVWTIGGTGFTKTLPITSGDIQPYARLTKLQSDGMPPSVQPPILSASLAVPACVLQHPVKAAMLDSPVYPKETVEVWRQGLACGSRVKICSHTTGGRFIPGMVTDAHLDLVKVQYCIGKKCCIKTLPKDSPDLAMLNHDPAVADQVWDITESNLQSHQSWHESSQAAAKQPEKALPTLSPPKLSSIASPPQAKAMLAHAQRKADRKIMRAAKMDKSRFATDPGPTASKKEDDAGEVDYITAAELSEQLDRPDLQIIDCRGFDFNIGHIPGCRNIPFEVFERELPQLAKELAMAEKLIVFHCMQSEHRGPACARKFLGYVARHFPKATCQVRVLKYGFAGWQLSHSSLVEKSGSQYIALGANALGMLLSIPEARTEDSLPSMEDKQVWSGDLDDAAVEESDESTEDLPI